MEKEPILKAKKSQNSSTVNPEWNWTNKHESIDTSDKTTQIMKNSPEMMINRLFPKSEMRLKIDGVRNDHGRSKNYRAKVIGQDWIFHFLSCGSEDKLRFLKYHLKTNERKINEKEIKIDWNSFFETSVNNSDFSKHLFRDKGKLFFCTLDNNNFALNWKMEELLNINIPKIWNFITDEQFNMVYIDNQSNQDSFVNFEDPNKKSIQVSPELHIYDLSQRKTIATHQGVNVKNIFLDCKTKQPLMFQEKKLSLLVKDKIEPILTFESNENMKQIWFFGFSVFDDKKPKFIVWEGSQKIQIEKIIAEKPEIIKTIHKLYNMKTQEILFETKESFFHQENENDLAYLRKRSDFADVVLSEDGMFIVWEDYFDHSIEYTFSFYSWERLLSALQNKIISISLQKMKQKGYYLAINYSNAKISVFKICNGIEKLIFSEEERKVLNLCISSTGSKMVALDENHDGFFVWELSENNQKKPEYIIKSPKIENIRFVFQDENILTFDSLGNISLWEFNLKKENESWQIKHKNSKFISDKICNFEKFEYIIDFTEKLMAIFSNENIFFVDPTNLTMRNIIIEHKEKSVKYTFGKDYKSLYSLCISESKINFFELVDEQYRGSKFILKKTITLNQKIEKNCFSFASSNNELHLFIQDEKKLMLYSVELDHSFIFNRSFPELKEENADIFSLSQNGKAFVIFSVIGFYDIFSINFDEIIEFSKEIENAEFSHDNELIALNIHDSNIVEIYEITNWILKRKIDIEGKIECFAFNDFDPILVIIGKKDESFNILVIDLTSEEPMPLEVKSPKLKEWFRHKKLTQIAQNENLVKFFDLDRKNPFFEWDHDENPSLKNYFFNTINSSICAKCTSLLPGIKFKKAVENVEWHSDQEEVEIKKYIKFPESVKYTMTNALFSPDMQLIAVSTSNFLHICDFHTSKIKGKIQIHENSKLLSVSNYSSFIATNRGIFRWDSQGIFNFYVFLKKLKIFIDFYSKKGEIEITAKDLKEKFSISKEFMQKTCDFGFLPDQYLSIFHYAAYKNDVELLESVKEIWNILDFSIDIGFSMDQWGNTPLDIAYKKGSAPVQKLLLSFLLEKPPQVSQCPAINIHILSLILEQDSEIFSSVIESRFVKSLTEPGIVKLKKKLDKIETFCYKGRDFRFPEYVFTEGIIEEPLVKSMAKTLFNVMDSYIEWFLQFSKKFPKIINCILITIFTCLIIFIYLPLTILFKFLSICDLFWDFIGHFFFPSRYSEKKIENKSDLRILDIPNFIKHQNSLEFLTNLILKNASDPIFENFFIRGILDHKWEDLKTHFYVEIMHYLYFFVVFTVEVIFLVPKRVHPYSNEDSLVSVILSFFVFVCCFLSLVGEVRQYRKVGREVYMIGLWNYIDWLLILITVPAFILNLCDIFLEDGLENEAHSAFKSLLSISVFVVYLKLLSFARGFDQTAFLVRTLIQVVIDIRFFIFFLFFMMLTLSFSAYLLQDEFTQDRFFLFNAIFYVTMGDASDFKGLSSDIPWLLWIVYLIITIFLSIIMLNLLISIIGDSYDKIMGIEARAKYYEKTILILNYEKGIKYEKSALVHYLYAYGPTNCFEGNFAEIQKDEGVERIREKVDKIELQLKFNNEKIDKIQPKINEKLNAIINSNNLQIEKINEKFNGLNQNFNGLIPNFNEIKQNFNGLNDKLEKILGFMGEPKINKI